MGCQDQIDPRDKRLEGPGPDPDSPLIGTRWFWDSGWEEITLYFESAETLRYNEENPPISYWYDKALRNGHADTLGRFSVEGNYDGIVFSQWKQYPHGAVFSRVD